MIRKAMILAAGYGTRLRPLTEEIPKPLLPIANKPLIEWHLLKLRALGVEEVMINLHHLSDLIEKTIGNGSRWGLNIHYSKEEEILGTGGGLAKVRSFFEKEEAFYFLNGDIFHDIDLADVYEHHKAKKAVATLIVRPHPQDPKVGWVGTDEEGWIRRVPEMPENKGLTKRLFTGLHILTPAIFEEIQPLPSCILRTGYRAMIEKGLPVASFLAEHQQWHDIGNPQSYLETNFAALSDPTSPLIDPSAQIGENCSLEAPCIIGAEAKIGAHSIIKESVILPHATIPPRSHLKKAIVTPSQIVSLD